MFHNFSHGLAPKKLHLYLKIMVSPQYAIVDPQKKISAIPNWGLSTPIWHQKISIGTGINSTQKAVAAKTCGPPWWIFVAGMHQQSENVESKVSWDWFVRTTPPLPRPPTTGPFLWDNHRPCIYVYIYMQAYVYTYLSCKLDCVHVPVYNYVIHVYCILCIYIYIYSFIFMYFMLRSHRNS